jgi:wyosine [tRNA(Phe)-imidazoG37] synthetase (radical SAM superfamily)
MATFLFDEIIFGPVNSRRLGVSLGINLLPVDSKLCSFDCIYCECGWTPPGRNLKKNLPSRGEVKQKLMEKLMQMQAEGQIPDVITFAGNGEPTLHPGFGRIIDDTVELRDQYAPEARIAVLSNATMLKQKKVFEALLRVDDNIQKLDSAFEETIRMLDAPRGRFSLEETVEQLCRFNGRVILQKMFVKGTWKGQVIDNTTDTEVDAWLALVRKIAPRQVMIYTIARDTPAETLQKATPAELERIAVRIKQAGFPVQVSL